MKFSNGDRKLLVDLARAYAKKITPKNAHRSGCCFWNSIAAFSTIKSALSILEKDLPEEDKTLVEIVAGNVSWPIVLKENDDGISPTHFSYEFEGSTFQNIMAILNGNLPECHVWVRINYFDQIPEYVDISTNSFMEACNRVGGIQWETPPPPNYLWRPKNELDCPYDGYSIHYRELTELSKLVNKMMDNLGSSR